MSINMQKKVAFLTLGCKVNAYETEAMEKLFLEAGYERVDFKEKADVYVVNTCTVTNIADRKSRQMLHRAKKNNPDGVVVAAGCYTQAPQSVLERDEQVDLLVGNSEKGRIVRIVEEYFRTRQAGGKSAPAPLSEEYEPLSIDTVTEKTRANVKIQDGCNQFCSYCIIPYVRGRIRSRKEEDVLAEIRRLAEKGYQEVVLTGIHLSSYGKDIDNTPRLLPLVREVWKLPGITRIRLGSLEPRIITPEFVETLASYGKVCPHFHLSLQSGCDTTLRRMNRHYTTEEYAAACDLLRQAYPDPAFTTDVIVGFPGETEEEFEQTMKFVERIGFSGIHIFPYSKRTGTRAETMEGQVPEPVKKDRAARLAAVERRLADAYRERFAGKEEQVLFEERMIFDGAAFQTGHTTRYVKVAVPEEDGMEDLSGTVRSVGGLKPCGSEILIGSLLRRDAVREQVKSGPR